jgi:proline-specific peptidase
VRTVHLIVPLLLGTTACATRTHDSATLARPITTDGSRLAVHGGEIWYRVIGSNAATPVILIHGGPGISSVYLKSMEALADERLVVRYDQLGSGKSDVVTDTSLFTMARFVGQLETLRSHLGVEKVHLYGHSWGATLAVEYYRVHPARVASMVLASSALDMPAFFGSMRRAFAMLPDSLYRAVQLRDAGQAYDTALFRAASMEFNTRHATRSPVLADMDSMSRSMNSALNEYMTGPAVLTPGGTLRGYDATSFLKEISVPVLFISGEFDFAGPDIISQHASLTPNARVVIIPGAGHIMHWDNAGANADAVRSFLREVDGGH